MFFERFFDANWRDDTNSEELLASGVTTKATKKEGMPLAVEKFLTASTCRHPAQDTHERYSFY